MPGPTTPAHRTERRLAYVLVGTQYLYLSDSNLRAANNTSSSLNYYATLSALSTWPRRQRAQALADARLSKRCNQRERDRERDREREETDSLLKFMTRAEIRGVLSILRLFALINQIKS